MSNPRKYEDPLITGEDLRVIDVSRLSHIYHVFIAAINELHANQKRLEARIAEAERAARHKGK